MPTRLLLIAHAETDATRRGAFPADEGIEPRGRAAAETLAAALPRADGATSSPARAARETAEAMGLAATIDPSLADIDVGAWAGRSVMEIGMNDPEAATAWLEDPAFAGHGGESFVALVARASAWLDARQQEGGSLIAVTHAAVLRATAIAALGALPAAFWRIEAAPLARLSLSSDGRRWVVRDLRQL